LQIRSLHEQDEFLEGQTTVTVNRYEQNLKARARCIAKYKAICFVCDFNFGEKYGELGEGFIEVHHINPFSEVPKGYNIWTHATRDLRPLCSNCHSMIHRTKPALTIKAMKKLLRD
jgi:5-methylcytosine-specific restriction protein A